MNIVEINSVTEIRRTRFTRLTETRMYVDYAAEGFYFGKRSEELAERKVAERGYKTPFSALI